MTAYRLGPSLGILTALLQPRHRRITFLYDSGGVIEFGNSIQNYGNPSQDARPLVLDVRSPEEYTGALGHINGDVSLPLPALEGRLSELSTRT